MVYKIAENPLGCYDFIGFSGCSLQHYYHSYQIGTYIIIENKKKKMS